MAIKHAENLNFGPVLGFLNLLRRLDDIQNNGDAVLVDLSHSTYVSVGCKCAHTAKSLVAGLGRLEMGQNSVGIGIVLLD